MEKELGESSGFFEIATSSRSGTKRKSTDSDDESMCPIKSPRFDQNTVENAVLALNDAPVVINVPDEEPNVINPCKLILSNFVLFKLNIFTVPVEVPEAPVWENYDEEPVIEHEVFDLGPIPLPPIIGNLYFMY
jgi:hypothetical protein